MTVRALFALGFRPEAEAFVNWLLHATRLSQPELRVLYDVYGNRPEREHALALRGYGGSRPVRVGNAAEDQLPLDVYGEVIDAAAQLVREGTPCDKETQRLLCDLGKYVCRKWSHADAGIWEPRSGPRHNAHSRVLLSTRRWC